MNGRKFLLVYRIPTSHRSSKARMRTFAIKHKESAITLPGRVENMQDDIPGSSNQDDGYLIAILTNPNNEYRISCILLFFSAPSTFMKEQIKLMVLFTIVVLYTFDATCENNSHSPHLVAYITTCPGDSPVHVDNVRSTRPNNLQFVCSVKVSSKRLSSTIL